jgi:hypothetical protein
MAGRLGDHDKIRTIPAIINEIRNLFFNSSGARITMLVIPDLRIYRLAS